MKKIFGTIFIEKEALGKADINYPIKLEYYKVINSEENKTVKDIQDKKEKYGINILKTEYREENIKVEEESINYISDNEEKIENLLEMLKRNEVTPISARDVVCDFLQRPLYI